MRILLRVVAVGTALQGVGLVLFGLSHLRIVNPPQSQVSVDALLLVVLLVFAGMAAVWGSVRLWTFRRAGRHVVAVFQGIVGVTLIAGAVSSGKIAPFAVPLALAAGIIVVVLSKSAAHAGNEFKKQGGVAGEMAEQQRSGAAEQ